ncbi:glycoside hydrolase [Lentinus tigrinus ALCF2SS1-7]|uniref:glucan 1,3-beta-glucosidase n=1 Tax=Lentinus tigrinus ALCF2SS1-6 TaxID=1328759 RepID=A0A5C2S6N5_9APHY|nr:glycoside hydrolase [Lentinus tigrinus ALCF2SS1-6]RPD69855.1 glycoside hydrolase [Lentinus tigrinus ALCF2SS1-7]
MLFLALFLPLYFTIIRKPSSSAASSSPSSTATSTTSTASPTSTGAPVATTGGDGSVIILSDGTNFTYHNPFGGYWVQDPTNPYNSSARAQSFTPALNESWVYSKDQIRGVNLGGWLVLQPYIVPALFEKYQNVTSSAGLPGGQVNDEWTLSVAMRNDTSDGGGIQQIEEHYRTFITEQDFAEIAGAGLNWIRLPIPYWAIETWPGEPFLAKTSWNYVLLAFHWARKYGLRIFLELHTVPGSQNGFDDSGRLGTVNFLSGYMGIANAQRTMDYIRYIVEFISQEEYEDVVPMFGILDEPLLEVIGRDQLTRFYLQVHDMIRGITGIGKGPYIVIHDSFQGTASWADFLPGSDRIVLDTHPSVLHAGVPTSDFSLPLSYWPTVGCIAYSNNQSQYDFGVTVSGEFSAAVNDCGKWVLGIGQNSTSADCDVWDDWPNWTQQRKDGVETFVMSQMDSMALPGYFYWTWKIGNSSVTGKVEAPFWSYKLGLDNGWIPSDPREALGTCSSLEFPQDLPWNGTYQVWQTGGAGAGTIAATAVAAFSQYPPPSLSNVNGVNPTQLPVYTATGVVPTLSTPTFASATVTGGDGWADAADTSRAAVQIAGCVYPNAWGPAVGSTAVVCGGSTAPGTALSSISATST